MPMPGYLSVNGQTQGNIEGGCTIEGHQGKILVQAVDLVVNAASWGGGGRQVDVDAGVPLATRPA